MRRMSIYSILGLQQIVIDLVIMVYIKSQLNRPIDQEYINTFNMHCFLLQLDTYSNREKIGNIFKLISTTLNTVPDLYYNA